MSTSDARLNELCDMLRNGVADDVGAALYPDFRHLRRRYRELQAAITDLPDRAAVEQRTAAWKDAASELEELERQRDDVNASVERTSAETRRLATEAYQLKKSRDQFRLLDGPEFSGHGGLFVELLGHVLRAKGFAITDTNSITEG